MNRTLAVLFLLAFAATPVIAADGDPGMGIRGSVHDMNVALDNTLADDPQGRTCAFCHTPHHAIDPNDPAVQEAVFDYLPLWSHDLTTQTTFDSYSSVTYQGLAFTHLAVDPLIGPSRLCMSCHDGTIAPDRHYGIPGSTLYNQPIDDDYDGISVGLDGNFANDHPIGFVFADAVDADNATYGANTQQGFKFTGAEVLAGTPLYPPNANGFQVSIVSTLHMAGGEAYMTCVTCHDVHNKDNAVHTGGAFTLGKNYLLYGDQNNSALCTTCHNK